MRLFEKMCYKAGLKVGMAIHGGHLSAEEKRALERKLYKEGLEEDRRKREAEARAARASASSYRMPECCANCFYFSDFMGQYCTKHQYEFTVSEEVNNVKYDRRCSEYRKNR